MLGLQPGFVKPGRQPLHVQYRHGRAEVSQLPGRIVDNWVNIALVSLIHVVAQVQLSRDFGTDVPATVSWAPGQPSGCPSPLKKERKIKGSSKAAGTLKGACQNAARIRCACRGSSNASGRVHKSGFVL